MRPPCSRFGAGRSVGRRRLRRQVAAVTAEACSRPAPSRYSITSLADRLKRGSWLMRLAIARAGDVDVDRRARASRAGPALSGMMRSASRMPSSTSLVISTTVLWSCLPDALDLVLQRGARQRVERAERLVEQQDLRDPWPARARPTRAGACRRRARAGFLSRAARRGSPWRCTCSTWRAAFRPSQFGKAWSTARSDVLEDGQPRQQRVVLEDDAAIGPGPGDRLAVERDRCPRRA